MAPEDVNRSPGLSRLCGKAHRKSPPPLTTSWRNPEDVIASLIDALWKSIESSSSNASSRRSPANSALGRKWEILVNELAFNGVVEVVAVVFLHFRLYGFLRFSVKNKIICCDF